MGIPEEQFVKLVNDHQRGLYAYILQLVPNRADANDILGETNLVLWRKWHEFEAGTSFGAWASRVAYFEVRAYRTRQGRERLCFDNEVIEQLAAEGAEEIDAADDARRHLIHCIEQLSGEDQQLLKQRYQDGRPPREIAATVNRTARAIAQALYRIRTSLMDCIEGQASKESQS